MVFDIVCSTPGSAAALLNKQFSNQSSPPVVYMNNVNYSNYYTIILVKISFCRPLFVLAHFFIHRCTFLLRYHRLKLEDGICSRARYLIVVVLKTLFSVNYSINLCCQVLFLSLYLFLWHIQRWYWLACKCTSNS